MRRQNGQRKSWPAVLLSELAILFAFLRALLGAGLELVVSPTCMLDTAGGMLHIVVGAGNGSSTSIEEKPGEADSNKLEVSSAAESSGCSAERLSVAPRSHVKANRSVEYKLRTSSPSLVERRCIRNSETNFCVSMMLSIEMKSQAILMASTRLLTCIHQVNGCECLIDGYTHTWCGQPAGMNTASPGR